MLISDEKKEQGGHNPVDGWGKWAVYILTIYITVNKTGHVLRLPQFFSIVAKIGGFILIVAGCQKLIFAFCQNPLIPGKKPMYCVASCGQECHKCCWLPPNFLMLCVAGYLNTIRTRQHWDDYFGGIWLVFYSFSEHGLVIHTIHFSYIKAIITRSMFTEGIKNQPNATKLIISLLCCSFHLI